MKVFRNKIPTKLALLCWLGFFAYCGHYVFALGGPPSDYRLIWSDDFDGERLDLSKWNVETGERDDAQQSSDAVAVAKGVLSIGLYTVIEQHVTGFLRTRQLFSTKATYVEARIRFRGAPGSWCAFWLQSPQFGRRVGVPEETGVEVDIVEYRKNNKAGSDVSDTVSFNLHWDGYGTSAKSLGREWKATGTLEAEWHIYAVLSQPDGFTFFVDNERRWWTGAVATKAYEEIRLTCEVRDKSWAGDVPPGGFGNSNSSDFGMEVDWVRVWGR